MAMTGADARKLVGEFSEMVFTVRDPALVWPAMLDRLEHAIGFDAGYIAAGWGDSSNGRGAVMEYDPVFMRKNLGHYLSQISPAELALYSDRARAHHDVWSRRRQEQLSVFRELLLPLHTKHMIVRVGVRRGNVAGFNLERRSPTPFTERELQIVDLIAPFLHIVEELPPPQQDDDLSTEFAHEYRLTKRESEFVRLAARGLQNSEIALLFNLSRNTVRNALARAFDKVGVSNRAELTYLAVRPPSRSPMKTPRADSSGDEWLRTFAELVQRASTSRTLEATEEVPKLSTMVAPRCVRYSPPHCPAAGG